MQDFTDTKPQTGHYGFAVCDNGDLIPITGEQWLDVWYERGAPLSEQLQRDDVAFVCSTDFATRWPTRESVVEHVAKSRRDRKFMDLVTS